MNAKDGRRRSSGRSLSFASLITAVLLAGCGSRTVPTIPSPTPTAPALASPTGPAPSSTSAVASPTASRTDTASPSSSTPFPASSSAWRTNGWPITAADFRGTPIFGPDGTVHFVTDMRPESDDYLPGLVAVDAAGYVKPGWPVEARPGSQFGSRAVGPDGSLYAEECGGPEAGCVLHRLGTDGRESPGWPFALGQVMACSEGYHCLASLNVGSDGVAYLGATDDGWASVQLAAVDASGNVKPGWPVSLDLGEPWSVQVQVSPDGSMFVSWWSGLSGVKNVANLWAIEPDGSTRSGWPVSVPGVQGGVLFGPQGMVVAWSWVDNEGQLCFEPRRTVFTVLGPDGRTRPGWPRGSTGFASIPVVDAAGTVYYVSETGKVYAHDRSGEIKSGWPVQVPGALHGGCAGSVGPYLAPDGTILVLGDEVEARSADGSSRPGWPYRPSGRLQLPCPGWGDTDCFFNHVNPVAGLDGTVYVVVYRETSAGPGLEVVALDSRGQVKPGWPYRLPIDPASETVDSMTLTPDGRLLVRGGRLLLALDPDGRISD